MMSKETIFLKEEGTVIKKYNVNSFQIQLNKTGHLVKASIANSLKRQDRRWKWIVEGDKVLIDISLGDPADLKGRIVEILS